jgi:hypothetical protein
MAVYENGIVSIVLFLDIDSREILLAATGGLTAMVHVAEENRHAIHT